MYYDEETGATTFLTGMLVGALLGASIALLTAPDRGTQVRARLVERARHPFSGGDPEDDGDSRDALAELDRLSRRSRRHRAGRKR